MLPLSLYWTFLLALLYLYTPVNSATTTTEKGCTAHSDDGNYYDLSPLRASKDYEFKTEQGHKIVMNVCKAVSYESWGSDIPNTSKVGGIIEKQRGSFSIGEMNTTVVLSSGTNPKIVMENGSRCKSENGQSRDDRAGTIIEFICDTSVYGSGTPRLTAQWPPHNDELACVFFIEWRTHYACPTGESGGPWGFFAVFAILVTLIVMLYLVFGTLYNRYVLQLRGFDQIPQFSIEAMKYHAREALDWFRDTMGKLYEGGQGNGWGGNVPRSWGGHSNANAGFGVGSQLPAGRAIPRHNTRNGPTTNSFSHQAQVDVSGGDSTTALDASGEGGVGGFVRPSSRGSSSTNPISHQNQTDSTNPVSQPPAPLPIPPAPLPVKKYEPGSSTAEERTFMLGDDDEEDDVIATPMTAAAPPARAPEDDTSPPAESESATQLRGRDLGNEGVIRL
ncbi:mannose-6-phosphate receptor binding domain-containing protein [Lentinula aciculospora]|uniref:Autophagy-related protein 27 n=1 Tax=Lentinula aciculospora TaxID=153920 RepID=A0A9W9AD15_9AGAR|nr:mannose-6-phosphate receptor binding domain-containing protein [Lentinula aciculospora]